MTRRDITRPVTSAVLAPSMPLVDWAVSRTAVDYPVAIEAMEERVAGIAAGDAHDLIWLLEHPPLYTAGTSSRAQDLIEPNRFPVYQTGRGGQYTYHGPGQRVVYVMLDLKRHGSDVRAFVKKLEQWIIATLAELGIDGAVRDGRIGVWVPRPTIGPNHEDKIAAIGIRVRRWVTFHGLSLNVSPDLDHFAGIVPCGISEHGVTSLKDLGRQTTMAQVDAVLMAQFAKLFTPTEIVAQEPPA